MGYDDLCIDLDKIMGVSDSSISHPETIRQIALYHLIGGDEISNKMVKKINPMFIYCGLYPNIGPLGVIPIRYKK